MKQNPTLAVPTGTTATAIIAAVFAATSLTQADKIRQRHKSFQTHRVIPAKELIISDLRVVESPQAEYPGKLSFGYLMEQAFGKKKAPEVVRDWLMSWEKDYKIAGRKVEARPDVRTLVIDPWKKRDGYEPGCGREWQPDFSNAPFNLLAIVNRMDMGANPETLPALNLDTEPLSSGRNQSIAPGFFLPVNVPRSEVPFTIPNNPSGRTNQYYGSTPGLDAQAGEGRFVFGLVDADGNPTKGGFTLILEYGLPAASRRENLYQWAADWHSLGEHPEFNNDYLTALVEVTGKFTTRRKIINGKTEASTASQLIRIRTNDGVFGETREFREFRLTPSNMLTPSPVAGTAADEFFVKRSRANRALSKWLNDQQFETLNPNARRNNNPPPTVRPSGSLANVALPEKLRVGKKFIPVATGAAKVAGNDKDHHFAGRGMSEEMRRNFSMQTCTGCHCGETGSEYFHIAPRKQGTAARLSAFLDIRGKTLRHRTPAGRTRYSYQEVKDRILTMEAYLNPSLKKKEFEKIRAQRKGRAH